MRSFDCYLDRAKSHRPAFDFDYYEGNHYSGRTGRNFEITLFSRTFYVSWLN